MRTGATAACGAVIGVRRVKVGGEPSRNEGISRRGHLILTDDLSVVGEITKLVKENGKVSILIRPTSRRAWEDLPAPPKSSDCWEKQVSIQARSPVFRTRISESW